MKLAIPLKVALGDNRDEIFRGPKPNLNSNVPRRWPWLLDHIRVKEALNYVTRDYQGVVQFYPANSRLAKCFRWTIVNAASNYLVKAPGYREHLVQNEWCDRDSKKAHSDRQGKKYQEFARRVSWQLSSFPNLRASS